MSAVGAHPYLASDYARINYASEIQWLADKKKLVLNKLEEAELKVKQDAIEALGFMKAKWNQWGVSRVLFFDQAIEKGLLQLPSALLSVIWRTVYAAITGFGFFRADNGAPDFPRQRLWTSLNNLKDAGSNLGLGLVGTIWPVASVWLENKFKAEKA